MEEFENNFENRLKKWAEERLYSKQMLMHYLKDAASKGKMEYCISHRFYKKETGRYDLDEMQFLTNKYRTLFGKIKEGRAYYLDEEKEELLSRMVRNHYTRCLKGTGVEISEVKIGIIGEDGYEPHLFPEQIYCNVKIEW